MISGGLETSMRALAALLFVACVVFPSIAFAQSPVLVKYCQSLVASYRQGVAAGKPPAAGAGQAAANCPTNPNDSIGVLEAALKAMDIELPPK